MVPEHINLKLNIRDAITKIKGNVSRINISQNSGEIYLNDWNSPGILKTISANIFFSNPNVKILTNLKKQLNCDNFKSNNLLEVVTVSGIIDCITF